MHKSWPSGESSMPLAIETLDLDRERKNDKSAALFQLRLVEAGGNAAIDLLIRQGLELFAGLARFDLRSIQFKRQLVRRYVDADQ